MTEETKIRSLKRLLKVEDHELSDLRHRLLQVNNRIDEIQSQITNLESKKKEELSNLDKNFNLAYTWSHYLQSIKTQKDFLELDLLQTEQDKEKVLEELSEAFQRTKTIQILLERMEEAFKKSQDAKEQKDMEDVFSSFTQVTKKKTER